MASVNRHTFPTSFNQITSIVHSQSPKLLPTAPLQHQRSDSCLYAGSHHNLTSCMSSIFLCPPFSYVLRVGSTILTIRYWNRFGWLTLHYTHHQQSCHLHVQGHQRHQTVVFYQSYQGLVEGLVFLKERFV